MYYEHAVVGRTPELGSKSRKQMPLIKMRDKNTSQTITIEHYKPSWIKRASFREILFYWQDIPQPDNKHKGGFIVTGTQRLEISDIEIRGILLRPEIFIFRFTDSPDPIF